MSQHPWRNTLSSLLTGMVIFAVSSPATAVSATELGDGDKESALRLAADVRIDTCSSQEQDSTEEDGMTSLLEPVPPTLPSPPADLPSPPDPEPEPYANVPDAEVPPSVHPTPAEPGLPPPPMPQPAEPGLAFPPMPQPAEPPPLSQRPDLNPSVPAVPEQEPTPSAPSPEPELTTYEKTNKP